MGLLAFIVRHESTLEDPRNQKLLPYSRIRSSPIDGRDHPVWAPARQSALTEMPKV